MIQDLSTHHFSVLSSGKGLRLLSKRIAGIAVGLALLSSNATQAQTLTELLEAARNTHPSIKAARQSVGAANKGVEAAEGRYWPTFSATLESGSKNETGVPTKMLHLEQSLWDGGATAAGIKSAQSSVRLSEQQLAQQIQQLQLRVIESWQTAQSARGRIAVAESVARRLQEHEKMMERRVQAQASTTMELKAIQVQVLQALIERNKAQATYTIAAQRLEQLTGKEGLVMSMRRLADPPEPLESRARMMELVQADVAWIAMGQPSVRQADAEVDQGSRQVDLKRAELSPQLYARAQRGLGSGGKANAYIGIKYSVNTGMSQSAEVEALVARVAALQANRDAAVLQAQETIQTALNELQESAQRYESLKVAVETSRELHGSYLRQFVAARKSWLDVMSAIRDVAQNEYLLNDLLHNYAGLLARLNLYADATNRGSP